MEDNMTTQQAIRILDEHSISHTFTDGQLMVEDRWMENGHLVTNWMPCPETKLALAVWLGY